MQPAMSSSARKFIGMVALAIFLLVYVIGASLVAPLCKYVRYSTMVVCRP